MRKRFDYISRSISKFPLVVGCICLLLGIIFRSQTSILSTAIFIIVCILIFSHQRKLFIIILLWGIFYTGVLLVDYNRNFSSTHISNYYENNAILIGTVENYPQTRGHIATLIIQPSSLQINEQAVENAKGNILVKLNKHFEIQKGDTIELEGIISEPPVFDTFDYKEYLETNKIYALLDKPKFIKLHAHENNFIMRNLIMMREAIVLEVRRLLPEPHAALLLGILLGTKEEFSPEFTAALSATGTTHIIAVSGYNITVISLLIINSLRGKLPKKLSVLLSVVILTIFIYIVGFENIPAVRALFMGVAVLVGRQIGRRSSVYSMLALAIIILLIINPLVYRSVSFQLSVASTVGLIILADEILKVLPRFLELIRDELSVTLAAIIATFPITFGSFGTITIWAPLANILVGPLVPYIMVVGALLLLSLFFQGNVTQLLSFVVWLPLELMVRAIYLVGNFPGARLLVEGDYSKVTFIAVVILLIIISERKIRTAQSIS